MLERIAIIFRKEMIDNLRDRRSLTSVLMSIMLGPTLMSLLFVVIGRSVTEQTEKSLELPVVGAEYAPSLIRFLEQHDVDILPPPDDPKEQVRVGEYDVVLIIPEAYGEGFQKGDPAAIRLVVDASRQASAVSIGRIDALLGGYSESVANLRLIARGISPGILHPLAIETVDVATPESQAAMLLNMLPYFMIFTIFIGGMHIAIDTTAGERERGSMEPLLINPVPRRDFVLGKLTAAIAFTVVALIGTLLAFSALLSLGVLEEFVGIRTSMDFGALGVIFLLALPMVLLATALQMIIASFSRSYKEAQSYLGFLPLIPALPGMFLAFVPVKATIGMMLIPTFGQQLLINQLMRQEPILPVNVAVNALATLVAAGGLVFIAVKLYEREKILFGR